MYEYYTVYTYAYHSIFFSLNVFAPAWFWNFLVNFESVKWEH